MNRHKRAVNDYACGTITRRGGMLEAMARI